MEFGAIEHVSQQSKLFNKQTVESVHKNTFEHTLASKINLQSSAVIAAEEVQKQTLMKAKKKKTEKEWATQDEEEEAKDMVKKLKRKLSNLLNSERKCSGF